MRARRRRAARTVAAHVVAKANEYMRAKPRILGLGGLRKEDYIHALVCLLRSARSRLHVLRVHEPAGAGAAQPTLSDEERALACGSK